MNLQDLLAELRKHNRSMLTLAALGADLRLRDTSGGDPQVRGLLQDVVRTIDPSLLDKLTPEQRSTALGTVRLFFLDALDLIDHAEREPGWNHTDPEMLEALGRFSRAIVTRIAVLSTERPSLNALLRRPGTFLDVGSGVGHLAIEAARIWPALRVVGLDIWKPSLALARANVAKSGVGERIELREQSIEDLRGEAAFSLVWLPAPFIPRQVMEVAMARMLQLLEPGGCLIVGQYAIPDEPLGQALARLRIVRSGGYTWRANEIGQSLREHGYAQLETLVGPPGVEFAVGYRAS